MKFNLTYHIAIAFLILILTSCSNSEDETSKAEKILIDGNAISNEFDLSNLVEDINIFPLQEVPGSYIGDATKILKTKNNYIIFDNTNAQRIVVYDNNGLFVKNVTDLGEQEDEILQLNDCWLNGENLEVYDFSQKKIFIFDKKFDFVKAIRAREALVFASLIRLPKSQYFAGYKGYSSYNPPVHGEFYKTAILDSLLILKKTELFYNLKLNDAWITAPISPFTIIGDTVRFSQNFDPVIYNINQDGISKRYNLVYTYKPFPANFESEIIEKYLPIFKTKEPDFYKINEHFKGYTGFKGIWRETQNYVILESFDTDFKKFYSVYDKKLKKVVAQARSLNENKRFKITLPPSIATEIKQNRFISVWPGYVVKKLLQKESPFHKVIKSNLEANYIIDVKFR